MIPVYQGFAFCKWVPNPFEIFEDYAPTPVLPAAQTESTWGLSERSYDFDSRALFRELRDQQRTEDDKSLVEKGLDTAGAIIGVEKPAPAEKLTDKEINELRGPGE